MDTSQPSPDAPVRAPRMVGSPVGLWRPQGQTTRETCLAGRWGVGPEQNSFTGMNKVERRQDLCSACVRPLAEAAESKGGSARMEHTPFKLFVGQARTPPSSTFCAHTHWMLQSSAALSRSRVRQRRP